MEITYLKSEIHYAENETTKEFYITEKHESHSDDFIPITITRKPTGTSEDNEQIIWMLQNGYTLLSTPIMKKGFKINELSKEAKDVAVRWQAEFECSLYLEDDEHWIGKLELTIEDIEDLEVFIFNSFYDDLVKIIETSDYSFDENGNMI